MKRFQCFFTAAILSALLVLPAYAADIVPVPEGVPALRTAKGTDAVIAALLNIPYRNDGAIDEKGRFTRFEDQETVFSSPGLNCSGFVLEASRFLFRRNVTMAEALRDRQGGGGADLGKDWDFGWKLVLNLSEGLPRSMLLPGGARVDPATLDGLAAQGFDLHAKSTWAELPGRIRPNCLYLVSFNKNSRRKGYIRQHYHVALLHLAADGSLRLTQTTNQSRKTYQRNLGTKEGLARFLQSFANTDGVWKKIAVVEVPLDGEAAGKKAR
ncbi:MAG: hypothetical protein LBH94_01005 [Deltaproteobacteria bacterium]|nr:hypothetical protein [Deltaproteobacteria bacterium]